MINAKNFKVNQLASALPDVSVSVNEFLQNVSIGFVQKQQIKGLTQEVIVYKPYMAVKQPMREELSIQMEGERSWKWYTIHATPDLVLATDDVIVFDTLRYRVMGKKNYAEYGYVEYDVIEDYQTSIG